MRALVVTALVAATMLVGCAQDRYSTSYDDFVSARQQDAVDRGWIPAMLPEEATQLREVHAPAEDLAVARATLPGGILPDECTETTADIGTPELEADWIPDDVARRGTPVQCGVWSGTVDGRTIVLWTDHASEAEPE